MLIRLVEASQVVVEFAATYWAHSSVILLAAWLLSRLPWVRSHAMLAMIWKSAALAGVVTALLQTSLCTRGVHVPIASFAPSPTAPRDSLLEPPTPAMPRGRDEQLAATWQTPPSPSARTGEAANQTGAIQTAANPAATRLAQSHAGTSDEPPRPTPPQRQTQPATASAASTHTPLLAVASEPSPRAAALEERGTMSWPLCLLAATLSLLAVTRTGYLAARGFWFHRRVFTTKVLDRGLTRNELDRLLSKLGIRKDVRLRLSPDLLEPCAYGLFRWTILLPQGIIERLDREEQRALLAHELAHLVRRDNAWLWMGQALSACFAWQPLNRVARRHWRQSAECLCDDWAIRRGVGRLALARCLTLVAEWRLDQRGAVSPLVSAGAGGDLVHRVERLVEQRQGDDRWAQPLGRSALVATVLALLTAFAVAAPRVIVRSAEPPASAVDNPSEETNTATEKTASRPSDQWRRLQIEFAELESDMLLVEQKLAAPPHRGELQVYRERLRNRLELIRLRRRLVDETLVKEQQE